MSDGWEDLKAMYAAEKQRREQAERERDALGRDLEAANEESQRLRVERDTHAKMRRLALKDAEDAEGEAAQLRIRAERADADNAALVEHIRQACASDAYSPAALALVHLLTEPHPGAALLERMRALETILQKWHVDLLSVNPEFNDPEYNALKVPRE